jgi:uncharacterized membrane-anchored protein YitT (DUF2179 family)
VWRYKTKDFSVEDMKIAMYQNKPHVIMSKYCTFSVSFVIRISSPYLPNIKMKSTIQERKATYVCTVTSPLEHYGSRHNMKGSFTKERKLINVAIVTNHSVD